MKINKLQDNSAKELLPTSQETIPKTIEEKKSIIKEKLEEEKISLPTVPVTEHIHQLDETKDLEIVQTATTKRKEINSDQLQRCIQTKTTKDGQQLLLKTKVTKPISLNEKKNIFKIKWPDHPVNLPITEDNKGTSKLEPKAKRKRKNNKEVNKNAIVLNNIPQYESVSAAVSTSQAKNKTRKKDATKMLGNDEKYKKLEGSNTTLPDFKKWKRIMNSGNKFPTKMSKHKVFLNKKKRRLYEEEDARDSSNSDDDRRNQSVESTDMYFNKKNVNKNDLFGQSNALEHEAPDENGEFTQDEDDEDDKQIAKKRRKICRKSTKLHKAALEKDKQQEIYKEDGSSQYHPIVVTSNMRITPADDSDLQQQQPMSTINQNSTNIIESSCENKNTVEDEVIRNRLLKLQSTIDSVARNYDPNKNTDLNHKTKNSSKVLSVCLEKLQVDDKLIKKHKTKTPVRRNLKPSHSSKNKELVSEPAKNSRSFTSGELKSTCSNEITPSSLPLITQTIETSKPNPLDLSKFKFLVKKDTAPNLQTQTTPEKKDTPSSRAMESKRDPPIINNKTPTNESLVSKPSSTPTTESFQAKPTQNKPPTTTFKITFNNNTIPSKSILSQVPTTSTDIPESSGNKLPSTFNRVGVDMDALDYYGTDDSNEYTSASSTDLQIDEDNSDSNGTFDGIFYPETSWRESYFFLDNIIHIRSSSLIFKNAELTFREEENLNPRECNKPYLPITRTINNNKCPIESNKRTLNFNSDQPDCSFPRLNGVASHVVDDISTPCSSKESSVILPLTTRNLAEHTEKTSDSDKSSDSVKSKPVFKIPILPPCKRPPTVSKVHPLPTKFIPQAAAAVDDDNDDVISLSVSSILFNEEIPEDDRLLEDFEEKESIHEPEPDIPVHIESPILPTTNVALEASPQRSNSTSNTSSLQNDISNWMETATNDLTNRLQVKPTPTTPHIFRNLCKYEYFVRERCNRRNNCLKIHDTFEVAKGIKYLSEEELEHAYLFAADSKKLYEQTFDYFLKAFEKSRNTDILSHKFIDDIFKIFKSQFLDKTPFVEKVIMSLCSIDCPYIDVIQEISTNIEEHPSLSDILLAIVCSNHRKHLYNNWCIVQQLTKSRKEPIDTALVEEMLTISYENKNIKLSINILEDILFTRLIDLKLLNKQTLNNFLEFLESQKVNEGQLLRNVMIQNGIEILSPMIDSFDAAPNQFIEESPTEHCMLSDAESKRSNEVHNEFPTGEWADAPAVTNNYDHENPNYDLYSYISESSYENMDEGFNNPENQMDVCRYSPAASIDSRKSVSDISHESFNITPPAPSVKSSNSCLNENQIANLEPPNNEMESPFNEEGNLTPTESMNCIPIHTLKSNEYLETNELHKLQQVVERGNNMEFLVMLQKFGDTIKNRAFILNTLVFFKTISPEAICDLCYPIIKLVDSDSASDISLMNMISMLTVNVLGFLERLKSYKVASEILLLYHGNYHLLCDCNWYTGPHRYNYSDIGKYIYICKILVKGRHIKEAWEIFTYPELKLIYGVDKWTKGHVTFFDNKLRNYVLGELIQIALEIDLQFAKGILLRIINGNDIITEINVWKFFNQMIVLMVDKQTFKTDLVDIVQNIIQGWYKHMHLYVMRGLLVELVLFLPELTTFQLYDKCCIQRCYPYIKGDERCLHFITNMVEAEIYMTFNVYMYKKVRNNYPLQSIKLLLSTPDIQYQQPHNISNLYNTIKDLKLRIIKVLASGLRFTVCIDYNKIEEQWIEVKANQLYLLYKYYHKSLAGSSKKMV